ncbi:MAG: hypothetical protein ACR2JD_09770 [Nocardioides sp.]
MDSSMHVDYTETDQISRRLDRLEREVASRAALGIPDTGRPEGHRLAPLEDAALDMARRLARLTRALDQVELTARQADEAYAARLGGLGAW